MRARVDRQRVNKRVVEALIKAGAFDALHPDRAGAAGQRRPGLRLGRDAGGQRRCRAGCSTSATRTAAQHAGAGAGARPSRGASRERLTQEKTALGFYLSGHLFDA
ncbi:MAG: hypothetical protein MZW92_10600 [Comamonadaceae bacterium]|nr:hypothetical protein [Comamonadaceae bacterium]